MFSLEKLSTALCPVKSSPKLWLGFSGGLDSYVLLHALCQLPEKNRLHALHINHGWHANAAEWAHYCQHICDNLNVPCTVIAIDAKPQPGTSPEAYARAARYAAFANMLQPNDCLLTAHQQDDQAETLLLQILRGAGVNGLAAMPELCEFSNGQHLRPLLHFSRSDLENYAKLHNLVWIEDESNTDLRFDRNYIRHKVLTTLKQRWPAASKTLARVAKNCAEAKTLLASQAEQDLLRVQTQRSHILSISALKKLNASQQYNVLRHWLARLNFATPHQTHLQQIITNSVLGSEDGCPQITWNDVVIRRYQDGLYALHQSPPDDQQLTLSWDLTSPLTLANHATLTARQVIGAGIRCEALKMCKVTVRFRQGGERFHPQHRSGSHPLKKLLQEWHIPPWERDHVPLIYCDEQLIAVAGHAVHADFAAGEKEAGWHIIYLGSTF